MYYGMIMTSVLMFSLQFLFNRNYQRHSGDSLQATFLFSAGTSLSGLVVLVLINQFQLSCSAFALLMAVLTAINNLLATLCTLKSLGRINLALYSIFTMLGGMVLPFLAGVLFFHEALTVGKVFCAVLIALALALTWPRAEKGTESPNRQRRRPVDWLWYVGIFILNGTSAVLMKIYQSATVDNKPDEAAYSILCAAVTALLSLIPLCFVKGKRLKLSLPAVSAMLGSGTLNRVGNYLLLIALAHVPASAQYPLVTGGVMIFSCVIGAITGQKPSRREIASVAVAFVGIWALLIFP